MYVFICNLSWTAFHLPKSQEKSNVGASSLSFGEKKNWNVGGRGETKSQVAGDSA